MFLFHCIPEHVVLNRTRGQEYPPPQKPFVPFVLFVVNTPLPFLPGLPGLPGEQTTEEVTQEASARSRRSFTWNRALRSSSSSDDWMKRIVRS